MVDCASALPSGLTKIKILVCFGCSGGFSGLLSLNFLGEIPRLIVQDVVIRHTDVAMGDGYLYHCAPPLGSLMKYLMYPF